MACSLNLTYYTIIKNDSKRLYKFVVGYYSTIVVPYGIACDDLIQ